MQFTAEKTLLNWLTQKKISTEYSRFCTTQTETRKLQQGCYHQSDIRMRSHRLLWLDDLLSLSQSKRCERILIYFSLQVVNRLAASCEVHAGLMQVVAYQVAASLLPTDLMQLDEVNRLDTTCWQLASGWWNPQLASSLWCFWLCRDVLSVWTHYASCMLFV